MGVSRGLRETARVWHQTRRPISQGMTFGQVFHHKMGLIVLTSDFPGGPVNPGVYLLLWRAQGFDPCSGKISPATEQLSL